LEHFGTVKLKRVQNYIYKANVCAMLGNYRHNKGILLEILFIPSNKNFEENIGPHPLPPKFESNMTLK
jgi:hypothetical protein